MIKLSLILPVYNVEKYVAKCLDSCLNQDLPANEYEIIIINDGSSDASKEIIETYARNVEHIKIIHQENKGISTTRNIGLKHATGKYIWFVDPDDYIQERCLQTLFDELEKYQLDVLWINWERFSESGAVPPPFKDDRKSEKTEVMDGFQFMEQVLKTCTFMCSFLFNQQFLEKNNLKFKDGITFEDIEFIPRTLIKAQRVKYLPTKIYHYLWRPNSISNNYNPQKIDNLLIAASTNLQLARQYPTCKCAKEIVSALIIATIRLLSDKRYQSKRELFLTYIRQQQINKLYYDGCGMRWLMMKTYNISPRLCLMVSRIFKQ